MPKKKSVSKKSAKAAKPKKTTRSTRVTTASKPKSAPAPVAAPASKPIPMSTFFFLVIAGGLFICGFFMGLITAGGEGDGSYDMMMYGEEHKAHSHEAVDISGQEPIPGVDVNVFKDAVSGYNVKLTLTNFEIVPEHASTVFLPNEGHAHLYINGEKIARVYSEWFHISDLPKGTHEITVSLNSHDHKDLINLGQKIQATEIITVE